MGRATKQLVYKRRYISARGSLETTLVSSLEKGIPEHLPATQQGHRSAGLAPKAPG